MGEDLDDEMKWLAQHDSALETAPPGSSMDGAARATEAPASAAGHWFAWDAPFHVLTQAFAASAKTPAVLLFCLLAVFTMCGATVLGGLPPMGVGGHDIFTFTDGAWRILQGQLPHVDFYSPLGPVYYFLWVLGLKITQYRVEGIVYATALAGVLLGLWSLAVVRNRLGALCATVCMVFFLSFWLSPFVIGGGSGQTTYGQQYNRLGYVLLLILFVELFGSADRTSEGKAEWGGLSSGLALGLLLFMKVNFFLVALVALAYAYAFRVKGKRHALLLLCGFLAVFLPMSWYLRWQWSAMLADLRIAGGARASEKIMMLGAWFRFPSRNSTTLVTLAGLVLLARAFAGHRGKSGFPCLDGGLAWLLLVLGCDLVLASSNMQGPGLPVSLAAILLLADQLVRGMSPEQRRTQWALAGCLFVVVLTTALPHFADLVSTWQLQTLYKLRGGAPGYRIDAPQMAAMSFTDLADASGPSWDNGKLLTSRINEGLALLRQQTGEQERIACVCFTNPFSYALLRKPARGGAPFLDYGFDFSADFAPSGERIVGDADVVIYPKSEAGEGGRRTIATLMGLSEPILSKNYAYAAESDQWVLLRRRR